MLVAVVLTTCAVLAWAQTQPYPTRPVRLIVPFAPSGSTDILARIVGAKLSRSLGQQFVVDNRPGAGGNIGVEVAAKAPADGYTLVLVTVAFAINPTLNSKLPFKARQDFSSIAFIATAPNLLVIHPSISAHNVADFIKQSRETKDAFNYASAGVGTPTHLAAELFNSVTGARLVHVPYKGGGPALADLVGGQVKVMFAGIVSGLPHVRNGRLRGLGVTSRGRSPAAPDIPAIAESGYPEYEAVNWYALLAPAGVPAGVVQKLNSHTNNAIEASDVSEALARDGAQASALAPEQTQAYIAAEIQKWERVVVALRTAGQIAALRYY
jgi:tripartite-type tricarboxylate transporter receptor subunit TctC